MKSLQLSIFLLTAFFCSSLFLAGNNDSLKIANKADSLFNSGNYYVAAIHYQKAAFFHQATNNRHGLTLKAGNCYKLLQKYTEAIELLSAQTLDGLDNEQIFNLKYQTAVLAYLNSDYNLAESSLIQLSYLVKDSGLVYNSYLLHALVLNEQFKWSQSRDKLLALNKYLHHTNPVIKQKNVRLIDSIFSATNYPKIKSLSKAARLSTFIPGAGQIYAGYAGEGLFSAAAIAVLASGMVLGIVYQYYFSSVYLGNVLIAKFYQGGIKRAEFLTEKRNYLKTRDFNSKLKSLLINEFRK